MLAEHDVSGQKIDFDTALWCRCGLPVHILCKRCGTGDQNILICVPCLNPGEASIHSPFVFVISILPKTYFCGKLHSGSVFLRM